MSELVGLGLVNVTGVVAPQRVQAIVKVIEEVGLVSLKEIKQRLPEDFTYNEIRCVWHSVARRSRPEAAINVREERLDAELLERLRQFRTQLATSENLPPFVFFHDSVLRTLATVKPASIDDLYRIKGLGKNKISKYGYDLLRIISN